ncbi:MAG: hypothetical protein E7159_05325 [Firmicutes bacterium]|nr:hypothetical protein [Bacillota bacterium]
MITFESALKVLKKYGYKSKDSQPYLYKNNKEIGINYSYIDDKYGITDRVISFRNDIDLDMFLKKYQWYKLNNKKYDVKLKLNNYEISSPEVLYIRDNHVMTDDEMFNIDSYDKTKKKNNRLSHAKKKLIEAENLMNHYNNEKRIKEQFVNNFNAKENELRKNYIELQSLVDTYNRTKQNIEFEKFDNEFVTSKIIEDNINELLNQFKDKLPNEEKLSKLTTSLWDLNKDLELNEAYMYALKYNDDVDEELRLTVTKIDYMNELLSKKRNIFKIVDLKKIFNNIDNTSTYESIYGDDFEEKYKTFVYSKYDVLDKIDEFRLCEYLNNFKTRKTYDIEKNIKRCSQKTNKKNEYESMEVIQKELTKQYNANLNEKEKAALTLYVSLYKQLFDLIQRINNYDTLETSELINLLNITDNYNSLMDECFTKVKELLKDNKTIKTKIFKHIKFNNEEDFIKSLVSTLKVISKINTKLVLKHNTKVFFTVSDLENINKEKIITTSSTISPYINSNNKNRVISARLKKGINILYSPKYLNILDNKLELIDNKGELLLDTRDINIILDDNIVTYTRFKSNIVKEEDYSYIDKYDINYKININKAIIEKRDNNE